jgi:hypothetical protein
MKVDPLLTVALSVCHNPGVDALAALVDAPRTAVALGGAASESHLHCLGCRCRWRVESGYGRRYTSPRRWNMRSARLWFLAVLVVSLAWGMGWAEDEPVNWHSLQVGDLCLRFPDGWLNMTPLAGLVAQEVATAEDVEGVEFAALLMYAPSLATDPAMFFLLFVAEDVWAPVLDVHEAAHPLIERTEGSVAGEPGVYEQRELDDPDGVMWLAYTSSPRPDGRHALLVVMSPAEATVPDVVIREMLFSVGPCPPPPEPPCVPEERLAALERGLQELRQGYETAITVLTNRIADLEATVAALRPSRELKVGVVDAEAVFTRVFLPLVQAERATLDAKHLEIHALQSDYTAGRIRFQAYEQAYLRLEAEIIQASLQVILTMLDLMIASPGFVNLMPDLLSLWRDAQALLDAVNDAVEDAQAGVRGAAAFTEWLHELQATFQQLDELVTLIAATKILEVTQEVAQEQGYHLVLRTKDVVLYRAGALITDLSPAVEERLRALFSSE